MFDRRFIFTASSVLLVTALSFFLAAPDKSEPVAPITENVSGIERSALDHDSEKPDYAYVLKEHDGRIAVYPADSDEPELVLDVLIKYLPDYDRSQMEQGIPVKSYDELVSLLEDYTS